MNQLEQKLQTILDKGIANGETGCASLLVLKDGAEAAYVQSGLRDPRTESSIARDTIFRLYSQSKPITSAAVMILLERGMLELNVPVSHYLPGFRNPQVITDAGLVPARREPTVADMLCMTAGCVYPGDDRAGLYAAELFDRNTALMQEGKGMSTVDFINAIGRLPLDFHPGSRFRYGTCADVLGAVVEVVDGRRFGDFLREEIFEPLGTKDTAFFVPQEKLHRLAVTYHRIDGIPAQLWEGSHLCCRVETTPPAFESGGAGLYSTVDDYAAFASMLLNGGTYQGRRILSPATVRWMTQPQLTEEQARLADTWGHLAGFGYGKLMRVCTRPGAVPGLACLGEYGWDGWLGTYFANFPNERMTLLYMTSLRNDAPDLGLRRKLRHVCLAELTE